MTIPFFPELSIEGVPNSLLSIQGVTSLLALISIFLFLKKTLINSTTSSRPPLPPGPKPWPIIGCAHFLLMSVFTKKPFYHWVNEAMAKAGQEIFCIRLGKIHVITITCPDIACEFFKKHDAEFSSRPVILSSEVVSEGYSGVILTPQNDHWKKLRRIIAAHVLSPTAHDWMREKRDEEADYIVHYVYNLVKKNGGVVDLRVVTQHYCGNLIKRLLFNKRYFGKPDVFGGPGEDDLEHVDAVLKIFKYTYSFCVSDYLPILRYRYDLDGQEKIIRTANINVRKYQDPEIDSRVKQWKEGKKSGNDDILDMLINLKDEEQLTTVQIKALLVELTAAGIDNPSNAIEWCIDEMLKEPYMFEKALKELDEVVGKDRLVDESDLANLPYIRAIVKESFRLHPFAPFNLPHMSSEDTTVAGYFIPKGSQILLSRPGLGRNPKTWDDPFLFNPERHLTDDGTTIIFNDPDLHIFSFSIGRRGCPGVKLGSLISVMMLARLLQAFTWHPPSSDPYVCCVEGETDLLPSKPLVALAKLRLDEKMFDGLVRKK